MSFDSVSPQLLQEMTQQYKDNLQLSREHGARIKARRELAQSLQPIPFVLDSGFHIGSDMMPDAPMRRVYEVTGAGFDGSSDETDDRVLWVVADNRQAIPRDRTIEFEGADAQGQGAREARQGIFRPESARAAVPLEVECPVGRLPSLDHAIRA